MRYREWGRGLRWVVGVEAGGGYTAWGNAMEMVEVIGKIRLFRDLDQGEREAVAGMGPRLLKFAAGQRIVGEGESGDHLYILVKGSARVSDATGTTLSTLKGGEVFGEVSFLSGLPRKASVVALEEGVVLRFDQEALRALPAELREKIKDALTRLLFERLAQRAALTGLGL